MISKLKVIYEKLGHCGHKLFRVKAVNYQVSRLYSATPSYSISKSYRLKLQKDNPDFIYGELSIPSFLFLLDLLPIKPGAKIIDLGCGDGKLLLAAGLYGSNIKLTGVEIISELAQAAEKIIVKAAPRLKKRHNQITIINTDFLKQDISQYDIYFINAAALKEKTWQELYNKLLKLNDGSIIISVEQKLKNAMFVCEYVGRSSSSWGNVLVYIYRKQVIRIGF